MNNYELVSKTETQVKTQVGNSKKKKFQQLTSTQFCQQSEKYALESRLIVFSEDEGSQDSLCGTGPVPSVDIKSEDLKSLT